MSKINIKSKSELSLNWKNEGKTVPYNSAIKISLYYMILLKIKITFKKYYNIFNL